MTQTAPRIDQTRVSRYQRKRTHRQIRLRGESWSLAADFNGALAEGATISSGVFRVWNNQVVILGAATKNARDCSIICTAGYGNGTMVKCTILDSTGRTWEQLFAVGVEQQPFFVDETYPPSGAYTVEF